MQHKIQHSMDEPCYCFLKMVEPHNSHTYHLPPFQEQRHISHVEEYPHRHAHRPQPHAAPYNYNPPFTMFDQYRNSSMHQKTQLSVRMVNRLVDRALLKPVVEVFDKESPVNRLLSEQPAIPVEHVDVVRSHVAFGRWALPRLYRELHSVDPIVQLQAINSVGDLVHDAEKTFEVIRLKFVPRLGNLLMRSKSESIQERILLVLKTMAGQALGRDEIMERPILVSGFKDLMGSNSKNVRCKTAALIEMLSRNFPVTCKMIEEGYIPNIVQYITVDDPEVTVFHLRTLERLFTHATGVEEGLFYDAFYKMVFLLDSVFEDIVSRASECLAMLVSHPDGKKIAVAEDLLNKMTELLLREERQIYTTAAMVIMFATNTVKSKHQAAAIDGLVERMLELCDDFNHPPCQMFAMKALGNMVEHPDVRKKLNSNPKYLEQVRNIHICSDIPELKDYKKILVKLVEWKPWLGYI